MEYFSTRDTAPRLTASEAISRGLAPDGGLFVPDTLPQIGEAELAELLGIKSPGKGVKVQINDGVITVDVIIMVRYGSNVVSVAKQVQDTVTGAVESMTGMGAPVVNVHVSGVAFDK